MIRLEKTDFGWQILINKRVVAEIVELNGVFGFVFMSETLGNQDARDRLRKRRSSNLGDLFREVRNAAVVSILESSDDWLRITES